MFIMCSSFADKTKIREFVLVECVNHRAIQIAVDWTATKVCFVLNFILFVSLLRPKFAGDCPVCEQLVSYDDRESSFASFL